MENLQSSIISQTREEHAEFFKRVPTSATALIVVDLNKIAGNYRKIISELEKMGSPSCFCAAVVKANAYGLGANEVSVALYKAGCRHFFVADLEEATSLKKALCSKKAEIFVLCGAVDGTERQLVEEGFIPALMHREQVESWINLAKKLERRLPAVLHIDTGINRTGITISESLWLSNRRDLLDAIEIKLVMSHLACAGDPDNQLNHNQLEKFNNARKLFPKALSSLASTNGIFLGKQFHFDMIRSGMAIYGLSTRKDKSDFTDSTIGIYAKILQINEVIPGQSVGYDATCVLDKACRLATIGIGYADGIPRQLSNNWHVLVSGKKAPVLGIISMDYICVDITDIDPAVVYPGKWVCLTNDSLKIEEMATRSNTISLEIACGLGKRPFRVYEKII